MRTAQGGPFRVFTPFARACAARLDPGPPLPVPDRVPPLPVTWEAAPIPALEDLGLASNPRLLPGGERAARTRLKAFLSGPLADYGVARDRIDRPGTSGSAPT